jgi:hypothetical protein
MSRIISFDSLTPNRSPGALEINTVIDESSVLSAAHVIGSEPRWMGWLRRGLLLLGGFALATIGMPGPHLPGATTLLLWPLAGLAILFALRRTPAAVHYACDQQGVYFPSRQVAKSRAAQPRRWLLVRWPNISSISVQLLLEESGNAKGVTFRLRASEAEQREYFSGTAMLKVGKENNAGGHADILVGFPSLFQSPHEVAALLFSYQRQHGASPGIELTAGQFSTRGG